MNITNIKPPDIKYTEPNRSLFSTKELKESEFKNKPNAYLIRLTMQNHNISQRQTARMLEIPWNRFQSWIMPNRVSDAPIYILKKLKEELNNDN